MSPPAEPGVYLRLITELLSWATEHPATLHAVEEDCCRNGRRDLFDALQAEKQLVGIDASSWEELPERIILDQGRLYPLARKRIKGGDSGHRYAPNGTWEKRMIVSDEQMPENYLEWGRPHSQDHHGWYYSVDRPMKGALRRQAETPEA